MSTAAGAREPREFVCVCVRVPKSGSLSLSGLLRAAFSGHATFYLPDTLDLDGQVTAYQRLRFQRSRLRNLIRRHRAVDIRQAYARIAAKARDGDLIDGGHIDFPCMLANIPRALKMVTILRDPVQRCRSDYDYTRAIYLKRAAWRRPTAALLPKIAGRHDFDGFLDFLAEHRAVYGNVASRFIGWDGSERLDDFFARHVFHSGVLEERERFAASLSEKVRKPLAFPHENRTAAAATTTVGAAQRHKIEAIYERDATLYAWQRAHL